MTGPSTQFDYVIVGGGFYGCCLALYLRSISERVLRENINPAPRSGRQERLENYVNRFV